MFTRRSRHVLVALLMTFGLAATACSSGGGSSNDATDNGSADSGIPDDFGSGSGDAGDFFGSGECSQLAEAMSNSAGDNDVSDFDAESFQETAEFLYEAAANAPAEISGDLEVIADTFAGLSDDPTNFGAGFINDDFIEATTNLTAWITENCIGIDLDG